MTVKALYLLESRNILRVHGEDAADFLQNTLTNDIRKLTEQSAIQYSLLLSPQGQVLHDLFVIRRAEGEYLLDIHAVRRDDLLRRLMMFKLRAKVDIVAMADQRVMAGCDHRDDCLSMADPRHSGLGFRHYAADAAGGLLSVSTEEEGGYLDACIDLCIPPAQAFQFEKDFVHDLGLQNLHAIAWDKGCFIGQEVAARVEHRGLAKKRLCTIKMASPVDVAARAITLADGSEVGELRISSRDCKTGLAVIKNMAVTSGQSLLLAGQPVRVVLPKVQ